MQFLYFWHVTILVHRLGSPKACFTLDDTGLGAGNQYCATDLSCSLWHVVCVLCWSELFIVTCCMCPLLIWVVHCGMIYVPLVDRNWSHQVHTTKWKVTIKHIEITYLKCKEHTHHIYILHIQSSPSKISNEWPNSNKSFCLQRGIWDFFFAASALGFDLPRFLACSLCQHHYLIFKSGE